MKSIFKKSLLGLFLITFATIQFFGQSQGVSITTDNSPPDESAMLDVKHNSKGILIPRISLQSGISPIPNPTEGLLIYNNDATHYNKGFYYWNTAENDWIKLVVNSDIMDNDPTNEIQDISLVGNSLSISGGSTVDIGAVNSSREIALFEDRKANTISGGDFIAGSWITRELNTTVYDNSDAIERIGDTIRLHPGTYKINAGAPAYSVGDHKIALLDVNSNDGDFIALGINSFTSPSIGVSTRATIHTIITVLVTTDILIKHRCQDTTLSNGLGVNNNFAVDEIYTSIMIEKID